MLTIAKLRGGASGSVDYYLGIVASGVEDYYAGHGEAPGRWIGSTAGDLGLDGEVNGDDLRSVLEGRLPGSETPLGRPGSNRTPGWDLTWSAPKSVSVLFGLCDNDTSREVTAAHDAAVVAGMEYLTRWALSSRRRIDGEVTHVEGRGMIAAGFRHRTSRALDPQLHTHALVANAVERADGTWGAIDSRTLFRHAKTAGFVYQAVLRSELTRRIGAEWGEVRNGVAEASVVPERARELFSTRRREIEAELDARGASSMMASRVAALRTRTAKGEIADSNVLRENWRSQLAAAKLELGELAAHRPVIERAVSVSVDAATVDQLAGATGLTESRSSFGRVEVVREWATRVDPNERVTVDRLDQLVAATLDDERFVSIGRGDAVDGVVDPRRFSTGELLELERNIVDRAVAGRDAGIATVSRHQVERVVGARGLSEEQAAMVRSLTTDGHRVDGVIGVAGSGKTYALAAAAEVWAEAGFRPIGMATGSKAAKGLQDASGIGSSTIDKFLYDLNRDPNGRLPDRAVLVVDEAAMVNTRKLAEVMKWMRPDTKLVLIGDHKQLPEIGAGGVLRSLADRVEIPLLVENRRQHDVDERIALSELRDGDVAQAVSWYQSAGRLTAVDDIDTARECVVDAWWSDRLAAGVNGGHVDQLLMAERRSDVARLNALARDRHEAAGLRGKRRVEVGGIEFAAGDVVMFTSNDSLIGVRNGERGVVTDVGTNSLVVDVDGEGREIPGDYLAGGHVDYGWAATVHKNQGATCDRAYLVASESLYRELGYVALSRGRVDNRVWTVSDLDDDPEINEPHGPDLEERDVHPVRQLITAMQRSAAQQLAIDEAADLDHEPGRSVVDVDELIAERHRAGRTLWLNAPERVSDSLVAAERRVVYAEQRLDAAADDAGWSIAYESVIEARQQLDQYAAMQARFDQWVLDHRDDLAKYRGLDQHITTELRQRIVENENDPPAHLIEAIGQPPVGVDARQQWRDAAVSIERQQLHRRLVDDIEPQRSGADVLELR